MSTSEEHLACEPPGSGCRLECSGIDDELSIYLPLRLSDSSVVCWPSSVLFLEGADLLGGRLLWSWQLKA